MPAASYPQVPALQLLSLLDLFVMLGSGVPGECPGHYSECPLASEHPDISGLRAWLLVLWGWGRALPWPCPPCVDVGGGVAAEPRKLMLKPLGGTWSSLGWVLSVMGAGTRPALPSRALPLGWPRLLHAVAWH